MPKYVMWGSYCEDVLEKRTPYRQEHLDGLNQCNISKHYIAVVARLRISNPYTARL